MHRLIATIRGLSVRDTLDRGFDRELESHAAMLAGEHERQGLPPQEALRAA